jgi:hypothetical protein
LTVIAGACTRTIFTSAEPGLDNWEASVKQGPGVDQGLSEARVSSMKAMGRVIRHPTGMRTGFDPMAGTGTRLWASSVLTGY